MEEKMAGPFRGQEEKRRATENCEKAQEVGEKEQLEGCGVRSQERRLFLKGLRGRAPGWLGSIPGPWDHDLSRRQTRND